MMQLKLLKMLANIISGEFSRDYFLKDSEIIVLIYETFFLLQKFCQFFSWCSSEKGLEFEWIFSILISDKDLPEK